MTVPAPYSPNFAVPLTESPSNVTSNSSVIAIGWVALAFHSAALPSIEPSSMGMVSNMLPSTVPVIALSVRVTWKTAGSLP